MINLKDINNKKKRYNRWSIFHQCSKMSDIFTSKRAKVCLCFLMVSENSEVGMARRLVLMFFRTEVKEQPMLGSTAA